MSSRRDFLKTASTYSAGGVLVGALAYEAKADSFSSQARIINIETLMQSTGKTATQAVQSAVNSLISLGGGTVFFPPGTYQINSTITVATNVAIEIVGSGWSSVISWNFNGHLFHWPAPYSCREVTVRDLKILTNSVNSDNYFAINCENAAERCCFNHVFFSGNIWIPCGSAINIGGLAGAVTVIDCLIWGVAGTGVRVGHGSEVRIIGGRIIGLGAQSTTSIGVHLTGDNGGVHITDTDIIALNQGVVIENINGQGSNREVFLTHATVDSCWRGIEIRDDVYVSIVGCWAASCDYDNIHVEAGYPGSLLVISGGTIFNAGAIDDSAQLGRNGITINSGSFQLTGVTVRSNRGKGIWVPNTSVTNYIISACKIYGNGQGAYLLGSRYILSSNVFNGNGSANYIGGSNYKNVDNIVY